MTAAAPTIRRAAPADLPHLAAFAARLVRFHHQLDPLRFFLQEPIEPGYESWLAHELRNPKAVLLVAEPPPVATAAPRLIGYAYGRMEPRDWNALLDAFGALHDIYVAEDARTAGVGAALLHAMARELKALGAPRVVLQTATANIAAQRLFEKLGFRRTMVEMTCELDDPGPAPSLADGTTRSDK